jgi:hypothetical protein
LGLCAVDGIRYVAWSAAHSSELLPPGGGTRPGRCMERFWVFGCSISGALGGHCDPVLVIQAPITRAKVTEMACTRTRSEESRRIAWLLVERRASGAAIGVGAGHRPLLRPHRYCSPCVVGGCRHRHGNWCWPRLRQRPPGARKDPPSAAENSNTTERIVPPRPCASTTSV